MNRDRNPRWRSIKSGPFHRIGDTYGHFFNTEHFLGRSAFDKPWLAPEPAANLGKNKVHYFIEVALPGYEKQEIDLALKDDILIVTAEKTEDFKDEYLAREIHFDTIVRHFELDDEVDQENIEAKFENGLLRITLPHNGTEHLTQSKKVVIG